MNNHPGYFASLWGFLWGWIQQSITYRLLRGIYDAISGGWRNSRICGWFRQEHGSGIPLRQSLAGRVFYLPVTLLSALRQRWGGALASAIAQSRILAALRCYLHNLLALNLRFLGVLLMGLGAGLVFGCLFSGLAAGVMTLTLLGGGMILSFADVNAANWLGSSALVRLFVGALGIESDFAWYDAKATLGRWRLLIAGGIGLLLGVLCGLSKLTLAPLLAVAAAVAVAGLILILARPIAGLYLLVFLAPLMPTMLMAGLSLLCLCALVLKSLIDPAFSWHFDGISFLILLLLAIYLVTSLAGFSPVKSLSVFAIYLVFLSAYFLVTHLITSKKQLQNLLTLFVLSGFAVCLYGVAQYVFGWNITQAWMDEDMFSDIKMRIYSTLGNPNVLGEYILLVLPVAIGLMWTRKGALQKVVYAGISAVMFGALILTFSRGCWIGLLIAAAIFITFAAGKLWGLGLIALPILPAVLPETILDRFTSIGDMKDSSTSYRVYIWMGTLAMLREFWLSGIGMGETAFRSIYPFYSYSGIVAPHSHNLFLQVLVESGVGGIVVFLLILILFLKRMMVGYQYGGGKGCTLSVLITAISAGVCGFLVQGMFDNCFYNYRVLLIFWCVCGMGAACARIAKNLAKERQET